MITLLTSKEHYRKRYFLQLGINTKIRGGVMNKFALGHFDIFDNIRQLDLDDLQSFFGHHGNGHSHPPSSPQSEVQFRTIDGSNNNLANPTMNQAGTDFARVGPANFADGVSEMTAGPNPREISNIVVAQSNTGEDGPHLVNDNGSRCQA